MDARHLTVALAVLLAGCGAQPPVSQVRGPVAAGDSDRLLPGWPGPDNTGPSSRSGLVHSADLLLTTPDEVVDGLYVTGCVVVAAPRVTIRNSVISCDETSRDRAVDEDLTVDASGFTIEDSEVYGHDAVDIGIDISGATIRRVNVHGVNDGIRIGSDMVIEDNWVHDMTALRDLHADAIQGISSHDVIIRGNRLEVANADTGEHNNAAIQLGSETGPRSTERVVVEDNYLDGGQYAINISNGINGEGIVIRGNTFGSGSNYGAIIRPLDDGVEVGDDNVSATTGQSLRIDRAHD